MSMYLKTLGMHVHLTATKKSYLGNSKHKKANAQALKALRKSLSKEYLNMVLLAQRPITLVLMMINSCSYVY